MTQLVHKSLNLFVSPEKFYVRPVDNDNELLIIDRQTTQITLEAPKTQITGIATSKLIHGILGVVRLLAGPYLIVITKVSKVGEIYGQSVMKIDETEIIPFSRTTLHLTEDQNQYNKSYLNMIKTVLDSPYFYLSYTYDLTHTLQSLYNCGPDFMSKSLFERADKRFVWNHWLLSELSVRSELSAYCIPVMHGFVNINAVTINRKLFVWTIISRRCVYRAGTRMFMRGIDSDGHPSNYVETEQIVEYESSQSSFVQIRGSIPLHWTQLPDLRYKPPPQLTQFANQLQSYHKHIDHLINNYGKICLINLVNHSGQELPLERAFKEVVRQSNSQFVRYESFDFHHECRKMRWDRLSILMDRIDNELKEFGYFLMSADRSALSLQEGVFRTNCIDSLDRTNVAQGLIAKHCLESVLKRFQILNNSDTLDDYPGFHYLYRNGWADNADICSIQYAGTGALKTDFTRTGKRNTMGAIKDGINSLVRYYKNNFADGFRQDAIDLFLGYYKVDENEGKLVKCPL
ncbi:unnamed protein product, partial [Medioppia subpectinata]